MNRRSFMASPLAYVSPICAMPSVAEKAQHIHLDCTRDRIALVCETFSKATVAFPKPMTPVEIAKARAIKDNDLQNIETIFEFASKWGVSLDYLICGDVRALIRDAGIGRAIVPPRGRGRNEG